MFFVALSWGGRRKTNVLLVGMVWIASFAGLP